MYAPVGLRLGLFAMPLILAAVAIAVVLSGVDSADEDDHATGTAGAFAWWADDSRPPGNDAASAASETDEDAARLHPDGVYPDLRLLPMTDLHVDVVPLEGGPELVVRFTTTIVNLGEGPLELSGRYDAARDATVVSQHVYDREGREVDVVEVGEFVYHPAHAHWHVEGFVSYRLYALDDDGRPAGEPLTNRKTSFCVTDDEQVLPLFRSPGAPAYVECNDDRQGISVGWSDVYWYDLADQWVVADDDGLADGEYVLVGTVAPDGLVLERDDTNNSAAVRFTVADGVVVQR
jgi:hypothetical protein